MEFEGSIGAHGRSTWIDKHGVLRWDVLDGIFGQGREGTLECGKHGVPLGVTGVHGLPGS